MAFSNIEVHFVKIACNLRLIHRFLAGCLGIAVGLATGCSGGRNPVEGQVLVNGVPAAGVVVVFHPQGENADMADRPAGVTDENGTFRLSTSAGAGAAVGSYLVTFNWPEEPKVDLKKKSFATTRENSDRPDRLGGKYSNPKSSQLKVDVKSGTNKLEPFQL